MQRSGQSGGPQSGWGGGVVGADYRQHDRFCMQDDKANFRPRSLPFVILNEMEIPRYQLISIK